MNTIFARVIEDSLSPDGVRLTTLHLRYPRFIHAEFMTHRVFSRNGRSSRAVPVKRLLQESIVQPLGYEMNRPGMASVEKMTGWRKFVAQATWLGMAHMTKLGVRILTGVGLHKQWANRPLEWFGSIDVLVTSTDWENFFALRLDAGAQPEIQVLAGQIDAAMALSSPRLLQNGQWHLPYCSENERGTLTVQELLVLSTARCARLTIEPFDGNGDFKAELARYERLVVSKPVHASPAEHQATPDISTGLTKRPWKNPHLHGNLRGWIQHRKLLANEAVFDQDYDGNVDVREAA
ncbi:FAD-dependent thymidylate synthase [Methylobacterium sp. AMS5]|uniref:FAD-dependent thymidylate synthase n=1 Tax=Methylobacterium sp. AMS5 TaxID=925818 RepID=UPI00074F8F00|nr:FAD-dependent thymidylate synthase [Methylobacterium sp. AMS5]AMB48349.1 thymidylate synthase [Methylobacterium sp. AMS5]